MIDIDSLIMLEGDLPKRAEKLVMEWAAINKDALLKMWDTQEFNKLTPLD